MFYSQWEEMYNVTNYSASIIIYKAYLEKKMYQNGSF